MGLAKPRSPDVAAKWPRSAHVWAVVGQGVRRGGNTFFPGVLTGALIAGWALFRFPPRLQIRNGLIMPGLPFVFFALIFVGGATEQMGHPYAWAYGALAGILIGGRYWSGPRFGAPRPPFNGPGSRRRWRNTRPRVKQKQTQKREKPAAAGQVQILVNKYGY